MPVPIATEKTPPAFLDQVCDVDLPLRLPSARDLAGRPAVIWRPLAGDERAMLEGRAAALRAGLAGYSGGVIHLVDAALGAMLGGFRSMRQEGAEVSAILEVLRGVLAPFPLWAIERGCLAIARGETGLDKRFAPNDAEICGMVAGIVRPYRKTLATIEALLAASVEPPEARRALGQAPRPVSRGDGRFTLPGDGKHVERVAAELAAGKAVREGEGTAP